MGIKWESTYVESCGDYMQGYVEQNNNVPEMSDTEESALPRKYNIQ